MKPNSGFVMAMLALCSVASADLVEKKMINADHIRLMDQSMTNEVKALILELASLADEGGVSVTRLSDEEEFIEAKLADISSEEARLIACIYNHCDRDVHISEECIMVCPSRQVMKEIRLKELRSKNQEEAA